jgi:hypothetical protein
MMVSKQLWGAPSTINLQGWLLRFATFLGVQWIGDLGFFAIISQLPGSTSGYIDFFRRYSKDVGIGAPIGDSLYGLVWFMLTQVMRTFASIWLQTVLIVLFMFGTLVLSY